TASNPTQVAAYLNKIKETEAMPFNALWRKELLHLSGGINAGEPVVFRQYVDGFKSVAEDVFLGGKVETISKQTLNVELINVKDQVNKGLDLITFFGHSGPGTIDIDIGYVSDPTLGYNNAGKYPGFLINGCNAGRFYDNRVTFGEDWMLTTNKGAKSFIAHSSFGFTTSLKQYSDIFYAVAYGDSSFIGRGIGEIQKEVARRYLAATGANIGTITQAQQMVLLGDPAVPLFGARKPDYEINNGSVSIVSLDGKPVTAQSSSFAVEMNVRNFGRALSTPLKIRLTRRLSDNSIKTYDSTFSAVLYNGTFQFIIKNGRNPNEFGNNSFEVRLDPDQAIGELNEANNIATINFFIPLKGTKNLFPAAYSIVNKTAVDLVFQNTDILAGPRSFLLEMDTASTFDSPYLKRQVLTQKVLATLAVNLLSTDSMVYYWRTKFEKPFAGESNEWATSSFIYIKNGGEGWAQSQFPQLAEATVEGLVKDPQIKRLKFIETLSTVELRTFGSASTTPFTQVSLKINQEEFNVATQNVQCRNNTLNLIAFDKNSTSPYVGVPTSFFDRRSCGRAPKVINSFTTSELETGTGIDLAQYVANIAANDSVVIFSIGDVGYASWSAGVKSLLGQFGVGINQMNGVQPGEPFVIFGKKGASSGSAKIFRPTQTPVNQQEVFVSKTITGRFSDGSVISSIIGPAQQWSQLVTRFTEVTPNDTVSIDITGISLNGSETILKTKLKGDQSLADIDAVRYPFLKLTLRLRDPVDRTAAQWKKWIVTYTPMAEGLLTFAPPATTQRVQEGEPWRVQYGFTNISSRSF
ncbi:MAG: hypothetical protein K2U26_19450, partial [Cyclobacteriaceae bacterium]|nr:hypothetical protein [Cyclobacteriaceae bacterium]